VKCTPSPILWIDLMKEDGMGWATFIKKNAYRVLVGKPEGNTQEKLKNRMVDTTERRNMMGGPRLYKCDPG